MTAEIEQHIAAARRVHDIGPFEVMEILGRAQALEAAGRRVLHMEIGEPDFTAPAPVIEAAIRALHAGQTMYTGSLGLPALREAIADFYARRFSLDISPRRIAVTAGASGALLLTLAMLVDRDQEVLVPDPGYPGYRHMVRAFEGRVRALPVDAASDFQPTPDQVRGAWGSETVALLLGSPANPSGTTIPPARLAEISQWITNRGGMLVVDEIYQGLVYGAPPTTAAGLPGNVILVNSFSKYFCMTGWRIGWAVLPEPRVRQLEKLAQHLFICPPTVAQYAALAALAPASMEVFEHRRREFERRRDIFVPALRSAGLHVPASPTGAFYVYADCSPLGMDGRRFVLDLLETEAVAATPGVDFGGYRTDGYVRFAYTREMPVIEEAAQRIARYCSGHRTAG